MEIERAGTQPSAKGLMKWFRETVRIDPLSQTPESPSRNIAIQERLDGKVFDRMEPVSNEQYRTA